MTTLIPANAHLAAKRGFIRTASQSLSAAIPTSAIAITLSGDWALGLGLGLAGGVVTALLAGATSYFSLLSKGIPEDYAPDLDLDPPRHAASSVDD